MDTAQWPQEIVVKPLEEIIPSACSTKQQQQQQATGIDQRKATRPQKEQALNCPRCNSTNTKFCYYNNYSLTQPRYFCKTCRRYWTEGGSLRNIPVGGGSRKNKRSSSSSATSSSSISQHMVSASNSSKKLSNSDQNPKVHDQGHDLNLAFPSQDFRINTISDFVQVPNNNIENNNSNNNKQSHLPCSSSTSPTSHHHQHQHQLSALELLTGFTSRGLNSFIPPMAIPDPNNTVYTSGFNPMQEFKPSLNFSLDGLGNGYGSLVQGVHHQETSNGRVLFPFEDLKQVSSTTDVEQNRAQGDSSGYWTGMLGGGSW